MYQTLIRLISPLIFILLLIEAIKRQGGLRFLKQRLGCGYPKLPPNALWIHCASVGEVKAAEPLILHFKQSSPLLVTTNTPTGASLVKTLFGDEVTHCYLPFDFNHAVTRFLKHVQPKALWVMETEIWPNLYRLCAQQSVPITLINARLSRKTLKAPNWLKKTYRNTLAKTQYLLVRDESEAERFKSLGADAAKIQVLGNLKYAGLFDLPTYSRPTAREYVLAASTHANEELDIAKRWLTLKRPECLVIVPRHPKRTEEIQQQLATLPATLATHSLGQPITADTHIYLDDRIGVLMPWFAFAKIVIMGGAFVPAGGHNVLEPAALKAPIITGPDMSDFEPETQLLKNRNALIQCEDFDALTQALQTLLSDDDKRSQMGQNAWSVIQTQQHILTDYVNALQQSLGAKQ